MPMLNFSFIPETSIVNIDNMHKYDKEEEKNKLQDIDIYIMK